MKCLAVVASVVYLIGSLTEASSIWPQPASFTLDNNSSFVIVAKNFSFSASGPVATSSKLLQRAFDRYLDILFSSGQLKSTTHSLFDNDKSNFGSSLAGITAESITSVDSVHFNTSSQHGFVTTLRVDVAHPGDILEFGVNESYSLQWDLSSTSSYTVGMDTKEVQSPVLHADTVFGALRGLETFVQLVEGDNLQEKMPLRVPVQVLIKDAPRFAYRGLMMDYARHFYPISFIKHTINAMSANKLNILHMHITDDQSFPMYSPSVKELAVLGAFRNRYNEPLIYTSADMQNLSLYAQDRGVLLVPEFDMPAHTSSWEAGAPEIMITGSGCAPTPFAHGNVLNPGINATYDVINKFLGDMVETFSATPFLHLGGDEVPISCWAGSSSLDAWMKSQGISPGDYSAVERYFIDRVASLDSVINANKTIMYWEEVFNNNASISPKAIIQAWKSDAMPAALKAGHSVTNSYKWYLNHGCDNYGDGLWADFYENDPINFANKSGVTPEMLEKVLGGETTMWSECVDSVIFDAIVWPRAAAAAEQLWSPREMTRSAKSPGTAQRMAEHRCRLVARGVGAAPVNDAGSTPELAPRRLNPGCQ